MRPCALLVAVAAFGAACATPERPVLYPNAKLEREGPEQAQKDVDACLELAARDVGDQRGSGAERTARRTAENTAVGAATGAAIFAAIGEGAARGAAGGAAGAATHTLARAILHPGRGGGPDPVFRHYVDRCLHERSYAVIGWRAPR